MLKWYILRWHILSPSIRYACQLNNTYMAISSYLYWNLSYCIFSSSKTPISFFSMYPISFLKLSIFLIYLKHVQGFSGGAVVKNLPANAGDTGLIPGPEDPTCCEATKSVQHSYWDCVLEPENHNYLANLLQLLKPTPPCPRACNKRNHHNEKPENRH